MEIKTNIYNKRAQNPTFRAIKTEMAKETLRKTLNKKELKELFELIRENQEVKGANLLFFGKKRSLSARLVDNFGTDGWKMKDYKPRFFEGKMHFIKRMAKKMVARSIKIEEKLKSHKI